MKIIGHQKIIKLLDRSIKKNSVSHAYVFSGPESVGKFTIALDFSEKLTNKKAGPKNPDLLVVRPETEEKRGILKKRDIKIEEMRKIQKRLSLASSDGGYQVVVIDEADRLNRAAQSALLKTLEEPNGNTSIILIVQDEKKLLSTILSRCQKIRFGLVNEKELEREISKVQENREEITFWSLGRPGLMTELAQNKDELDFRKESLKELLDLPNRSVSEKFLLAEKYSKDINLAEKNLNLWMVAIRESVLGERSLIRAGKDRMPDLIMEIEKSLNLIRNTNSNPRLVLENLLLLF